jgi:hypothetical protein
VDDFVILATDEVLGIISPKRLYRGGYILNNAMGVKNLHEIQTVIHDPEQTRG